MHSNLQLSRHYSNKCILDEAEYHIFWISQMPPWREYTHVQDAINQGHRHLSNFHFSLKVQATIPHLTTTISSRIHTCHLQPIHAAVRVTFTESQSGCDTHM